MVFFVVSGKSITFTLKLTGEPAATTVSFKKKEGGAPVSELIVAAAAFNPLVEGGKTVQVAQYRFAAPALAPEQRELDVLMTHDKQGDAKPIPIKVYRDSLNVKVTQTAADGVVAACPSIDVGIKVAPNADWMASRRLTDATPMQKRVTSNEEGLATVTGLPYGGVSAEILSPGVMLEETAKGGDTWTFKVKPDVKAKFVFPAPLAAGAAPHKQFVNLDGALSAPAENNVVNPSYGSKVSVKVAGLVNDVPTRNVRVFLGVLFSAKNSPRTGLPRPALETAATVPGTMKLADQVTDETGHAVFELEVGAAGGDQVQLFAAGEPVTEAANDSATALVNWRRVQFNLFKIDSPALAATNPQVPPEAKTKIDAELAKGFIEIKWRDVVASTHPAGSQAYPVTGDFAEEIGLPRAGNYAVWVGANAPHKSAGTFFGAPMAYPPNISVLLVDKMWAPGAAMSWALKAAQKVAPQVNDSGGLKTAQEGKALSNIGARLELVVPPGGKVLSRRFNGETAVMNWQEQKAAAASTGEPAQVEIKSHWAPQDSPGEKHDILPAYVTVVPGSNGKKIAVQIPPAQTAGKKAANLFLRMATYIPGEVGSANTGKMTVSCAAPPLQIAYTVLHEFGHCAGAVPENPSKAGMSGDTAYGYWFTKDGGHCHFGLKPKDATAKAWNDPLTKVRGSCCMYSPIVANTDYSKVSEYCENCIKFIKAGVFQTG